jgi:hypothetical protein
MDMAASLEGNIVQQIAVQMKIADISFDLVDRDRLRSFGYFHRIANGQPRLDGSSAGG